MNNFVDFALMYSVCVCTYSQSLLGISQCILRVFTLVVPASIIRRVNRDRGRTNHLTHF